MLSLFISTYNEYVIIALLKDGKEIVKQEEISNKGHSRILVPLIDKILKDKKLDIKDLNEILVINGPGSFTGVRLGITVAKTLAYTLNIPIKTITSIEAIACSINEENKIVTINDPKGKYIGKFENNELKELIYLKEEDAIKYFSMNKLPVYNQNMLDIEAIYNYSKNINETVAHAVKAAYIKEIEALNGK